MSTEMCQFQKQIGFKQGWIRQYIHVFSSVSLERKMLQYIKMVFQSRASISGLDPNMFYSCLKMYTCLIKRYYRLFTNPNSCISFRNIVTLTEISQETAFKVTDRRDVPQNTLQVIHAFHPVTLTVWQSTEVGRLQAQAWFFSIHRVFNK